MFLISHLLCLLLGLLALDTVHASPLTEVQLQNETLALDTVHTAAASAEVKLQRGSCPMFWFSFNGRCYMYVATRLSWADAERNCVSQDANLVSIHSVEEHDFVRTLINVFDVSQVVTWVGLSDVHKEGWWTWSDGSKVSYTLWQRGEPNNNDKHGQNCGVTNCGTDWCCGNEWCDTGCWNTYASICEIRMCF